MAQTEDGSGAQMLMAELMLSKILDKYNSTEISTAFMGLAAEAIHRDRHLPPIGCLRVIVSAAEKMIAYEKKTGMLKSIFSKSQWRVRS